MSEHDPVMVTINSVAAGNIHVEDELPATVSSPTSPSSDSPGNICYYLSIVEPFS